MIGFDVGVQTLLMHSLLATGYGLGDRFVIGGVEFFGTTDDTRSVVVGEIFDGRSAMWAAPGVLMQTASVLRGQPSINTGQMNGATTAFGETNGLVSMFLENVHANDALLIYLEGVAAFERHHDGLTDGL